MADSGCRSAWQIFYKFTDFLVVVKVFGASPVDATNLWRRKCLGNQES